MLSHNFSKKITLTILLIILIATCGCISDNGKNESTQSMEDSDGKIIVAVSILPQQEFVEKIGGDRVKTVLMIPPGASPATHEPTPGQLQEISDARMYAIVGSNLPFEEVWLEKLQDINKDMIIVDCSEGIELREMEEHDEEQRESIQHADEEEMHSHEGTDPHIWTNPLNAQIMVKNIHEALVEIDPENETYYTENKESYLAELEELDSRIRDSLEGKEGAYIMAFHPSWGYFADEYGINMLTIETEGKEPSAKELSKIVDSAREHEIKVIFVQSQFSTQSAEAIAEEIDGQVIQIDPLAKDYIENLDNVTTVFATAIE
ncbi:zinc transport system substrate-binding protein [Methanohalophilus levihalophilus]|uniref:metal ABC transporter solute-binding protein, Zn/Mn family n=1 Tax=Methanohalophilus levihalophilus TaxID=1431282 RepID=UPI001AE98100|nr:zinc ABC transporter substrate-binding protein [Methanohalophilus levihalophilus]MBP2029190.1 zinc transport system substrate-binding protein [Methanohalophilus levihalophilus]